VTRHKGRKVLGYYQHTIPDWDITIFGVLVESPDSVDEERMAQTGQGHVWTYSKEWPEGKQETIPLPHAHEHITNEQFEAAKARGWLTGEEG